jgi:hypothetical protein
MYPTLFPLAEITRLIAILRAGTLKDNIQEVAKCAWLILGYVLSLVPGIAPPVLRGAEPAKNPTGDETALLLDLYHALGEEHPATELSTDLKGSQLTVFWHTYLEPLLKSMLAKLLDWLGQSTTQPPAAE